MKSSFPPVCLEKDAVVHVAVCTGFREPDSVAHSGSLSGSGHDLLFGVSIKIMERDSVPGTTAWCSQNLNGRVL